jgi:PilZ domain
MTAPDSDSGDQTNRRAGDRMEILGDLHGEVMVYQPMAVRELSSGGAQVETAFPLLLDSLHELRLHLGSTSIVVRGRVVHCAIADMDRAFVTYRSGLEFVQLSPGVSDVIALFIDAVNAGRIAR